ncbi:UNVERIFIED_ORG: hypothetical protein BDU10_7622 [Burkholderia sp. CF145]|jgi:hypothetical protein|uniref:hypothetical protein n=1 Tax=Paraburkholderia hospita TaxID=169430 RepID=UPI000271B758|nr:hypothetical protein [Paraburkholderia hospita]EUC18579.1 hypothetical protein PMI06_000165 [Burkholderia sp. BT03]SKD04030.1 hypothetical protein SAMN06266956_8574 [Paraburkholderia hospita]
MMELLKKLLYRVRLLKPPVLVKAIGVSTVKTRQGTDSKPFRPARKRKRLTVNTSRTARKV